MKELTEYRKNLLQRLSAAAQDFRAACGSVREVYQPVEGGWNVHQLAAHTRDVDKLVYGLRARRTVMEENPLFENFEAETYHAAHYDPGEPLDKILDEFTSSVDEWVKWLGTLPVEAWSRESRHATQGGSFAMQTWVERGLAHIEEHLASVRKAR